MHENSPSRHARPSTQLRVNSGGHPEFLESSLDSRLRGNDSKNLERVWVLIRIPLSEQ